MCGWSDPYVLTFTVRGGEMDTTCDFFPLACDAVFIFGSEVAVVSTQGFNYTTLFSASGKHWLKI